MVVLKTNDTVLAVNGSKVSLWKNRFFFSVEIEGEIKAATRGKSALLRAETKAADPAELVDHMDDPDKKEEGKKEEKKEKKEKGKAKKKQRPKRDQESDDQADNGKDDRGEGEENDTLIETDPMTPTPPLSPQKRTREEALEEIEEGGGPAKKQKTSESSQEEPVFAVPLAPVPKLSRANTSIISLYQDYSVDPRQVREIEIIGKGSCGEVFKV